MTTISTSFGASLASQARAAELARDYDNLVLLCGHYEGIDERIIELEIDEEISVGNYVLTGGELPAAIVVDCVSRLIDGVLPSSECYSEESLQNGLLFDRNQDT
jgi:tRNA (guanine37-N1)-methyltransferase